MPRCAIAILDPFCVVLWFLSSHLPGQRTFRLKKASTHAQKHTSAFALLDLFCAVRRTYLVREQFPEKGFPRMRRCALSALAILDHFCAVLRFLVAPTVLGRITVRRKRLSTHAQMCTSALAIFDPFCVVLRFLVAPTRSKNISLKKIFHACADAHFRVCYILDPFSAVLPILVMPLRVPC
jgi:hypothetical protein